MKPLKKGNIKMDNKNMKIGQSLTIAELYNLAKQKGAENKLISISYVCDNDWYNFSTLLHSFHINFLESEVTIELDQDEL